MAVISALVAATLAGGAIGAQPALDGELTVTDRRIEAGERTGLIVTNTGERTILYGLGARKIQRREGGAWVNARDEICPDGCPQVDVGLTLRPGESGGPRYGRLRDYVRFPRSAAPGRYRLAKEIRRSARPRRGKLLIREAVRVLPAE